MSYCRFSADSDVYVIAHAGGGWVTYLHGGTSHKDRSLSKLRNRLLALRESGLKVPDYALDRIMEEMACGYGRRKKEEREAGA